MTEGNENNRIEKFYENMNNIADPIRNEDRRLKRISHLVTHRRTLQLPNPEAVERVLKLSSLQRTLKDKERDLQAIEHLLSCDLSSSPLQHFCKDNPSLTKSLHKELDAARQHSSQSDEVEITRL